MKFLLDENISARIVKYIIEDFPDTNHIDYLKMQASTDTTIWEFAKEHGFIIVSKDNDFRERSFMHGAPPKVIWLSVGNSGTQIIKELILSNLQKINNFNNNEKEGLLILDVG